MNTRIPDEGKHFAMTDGKYIGRCFKCGKNNVELWGERKKLMPQWGVLHSKETIIDGLPRLKTWKETELLCSDCGR